MKFTLKEFIADILASEMNDEQKATFIEQVVTTGKVSAGFYLRKNEDNTYECWFRNVDENGMTDHGPTNFTTGQVIQEYMNSIGLRL